MGTKRWTTLAAAAVGVVALAAPQQAVATKTLFFEETAGAFWEVPHTCADGSVVPGTLLVQTTRDFESPDTEDTDPTTRLQFLAVCPGRDVVLLGRAATATARVVFDGTVLVDGPSNHPTRPAPFIRVDTER